MNILQKEDLAAAGFANTGTNAAGGIAVRTDAGSTVGAAITAATPDATTTVKGLVELATVAETDSFDAVRAVTPSGFKTTLAADTGAGLVGWKQNGTGAVPRTLDERNKEVVYATDFMTPAQKADVYAGTALVDVSDAIAKALATGLDVQLHNGKQKVSPAAVINVSNNGAQRIFGLDNTVLVVDLTASTDVFSFAGAVSLENITFDFNNKPCRYALRWLSNSGHITLNNIAFENLNDTDSSTGSISAWINETGNTFEIDNIRFLNLKKRGDNAVGGSAGSYNGLYIGGGAGGSTQGSIKNVYASEVHNVDSANAVIYEDTSIVYVATDSADTYNSISIENVHGYNFGKRLLKVHASNVTVNTVTGHSNTGDSLGIVGFLTGQGLGVKRGCSATNIKATGLMDYAVFNDAPGVTYRNISTDTQPGNKAGMVGSATGLYIAGDDTFLDGMWSNSQRDISFGSATQVLKNTRLTNITTIVSSTKTVGGSIRSSSDTSGYDGLVIHGLTVFVDGTAAASSVLNLTTYLNSTTKRGKNVSIDQVVAYTAAPLNSQLLTISFNDTVSIHNLKYLNTSGVSHFRVCEITSCSDVKVDDVTIAGVNAAGVFVRDCTGRNTVSRVLNSGASVAAVYNFNSADMLVYACDHTKVAGTTTPTPQQSKITTGATATRPTLGLVQGYSQHFDTVLNKPIWWSGTAWVDATGITV